MLTRKKSLILWSTILALLLAITAACAPAAAPAPAPAPKEAPKAEAPKTSPPSAAQAEKPAAAPAAKPAAAPAEKPAAAPAKPAPKPEMGQIKIGVMPIENNGAVYAADKLGYFKDEGLSVELTTLGGGAEILPGVAAGKIQFGYSNIVSVLQAREQGFDFVVVSGMVAVPNAVPDADRIMIKADSPIKSAQDLVGKRMGTNNLRNVAWLIQRVWLKQKGVDPDSVTFREVPFPQMADAITNGQIEAGYMIEPFAAGALGSGKLKVLANPFVEFQPGMDLAVFAASEKWVKENPATTVAFVKAVGRTIDQMNKDMSVRKKYGIEFTKTDPAMMDKMVLAPIRIKMDAPSLQKTADVMLEHKLLEKKLDSSRAIWETAK